MREPLLALHEQASELQEIKSTSAGIPQQDADEKNHPLVFLSPLSTKAQHFLEQAQLTPEELQQAGIDLSVLDQVLNRKLSGRILRWLAFDDTAVKMLLYPLLDERGIAKGFVIPRSIGWRDQCSEWCSTRVWPRASAVPFQAETNIRRAYGATAFSEGAETIITRVWSALLFSFLATDLHDYYAHPDERYNTTLFQIFITQSEKEASLTRLLSSPYIWPALMAAPILWGTIQALRRSCQVKALDSAELLALQQTLQQYQSNLCNDTLPWLLPINPVKDALDQIRGLLLWDNRLTGSQRRALTNTLVDFVRRANKLAQLEGIDALAGIVDGVAKHDMLRLQQAGTSSEIIQELLYAKTQALAELQRLGHRYVLDERATGRYAKYLKPLTRYVLTHYALWCLGQPMSRWNHPTFGLFKAGRVYVKSKFFYTLFEGIYQILQQYLAKKDCEGQGKLWLYMDRVADYVCSFCGDLPVYYKNIFTAKDCLTDYLHFPRNSTDIVRLLKRIQPKDNVTVLDLQNQPLGDEGRVLESILPLLSSHMPALEVLYLNVPLSHVSPLGGQRLAPFLVSSHLSELYLSGQSIGTNGTLAIARSLPPSMQILDLGGNGMDHQGAKALAAGLPGSAMQILSLDGNGIGEEGAKALATALPSSALQVLFLSDNSIGEEGAKALAAGLPGSALRTLYLGYNGIREEGIKALAAGLTGSALHTLLLSYNGIREEGIKALAAGLPGSALQRLDLIDNGIGEEGAKGLAAGLPGSALQELNLDNNDIGDQGAKALAVGLAGSALQRLDLIDNGIGDEGAKALAAGLSGSALQRLSLGSNGIGDEGAKALAVGFPGSALQILDLDRNGIGNEGAKALAAGLSGSALQRLSLGNNGIGNEGAIALAAGLPGSALQILNLDGNGIGNEGAKALAAGLSGSALQRLSLGNNGIGNEGAKALAAGLPGSALQILNLDGNGIGDEGAKALAAGLPGSALQILRLDGNGIGDAGAKALAAGLPGSALQALVLSVNGIGDEGVEAIATQLTTTKPIKSQALWIASLSPDAERALVQAEPNTNLTNLWLGRNKINTMGATALCRVLPQTQISVATLGLEDNPSDPHIVDPRTCVISSGTRLQPLLPYRVLYQAYVIATTPIIRLYGSIKNGIESQASSSIDQVASTPKTPKRESKPAVDTRSIILPKEMQGHATSTTFTLLKTLATSSELTVPPSEAATTPDLNITLSKVPLGDTLVAARWGTYYALNIIDHVSKYSPFTLPWNRENPLSATIEEQLHLQQKQLQNLVKTIIEQQASRTGKNQAFNDKFTQLNTLKSDTEKRIQTAFKTKKISSSNLKTITKNLNKIEQIIHELSDYNRQLKKSAVKVRRAVASATHKKEQLMVITKKDFVRGTCTQEVVKLDTPAGHSRLSGLLQFWHHNTSSCQTAPVAIAKISDKNQLSDQPKAQLKADR